MNAHEITRVEDRLTSAQIQFFKDNGYLILDNFIEPAIVERWQQAICKCFEVSSEDDDHLNISGNKEQEFNFTSESSLGNHLRLSGVLKQLLGGTFEFASEDLIIIRPTSDQEWSMPLWGHIDRFLPSYRSRFMIGLTTYAYEVLPKGGGTIIWPKSHLTNWEYFQAFPDHHYGNGPVAGIRPVHERLTQRAACAPIEFTAKPGTVLLWHSFMLHTASLNINNRPRMAIFCRWGQPLQPEQPRETFGDIWENWTI
jgi:ectoine hydroxylase-related dioxygenase (phytanoyl-CoA dioxygenase family)